MIENKIDQNTLTNYKNQDVVNKDDIFYNVKFDLIKQS